MGNLIAPLVDSFLDNVPHVFNTPYTEAEIAAIEKEWRPALDNIEKDIIRGCIEVNDVIIIRDVLMEHPS